MKTLVAVLFSVFYFSFLPFSTAQIQKQKDPETGFEVWIGKIKLSDLEDLQGYENLMLEEAFEGKPEHLEQLKNGLEGVSVKAYIGTWCDDSQYYFPLLIQVLRQASFHVEQMEIYGLDKNKNYLDGVAAPNEVKLVPTLIFYRDNKEIGRFVETPKKGILEDLLKIVKSN